MKRREFVTLIGGAAAWPLAARAQQAGKVPTIGVLGTTTPAAQSQLTAALVERLRELGWIENRKSSRIEQEMTGHGCSIRQSEGVNLSRIDSRKRTGYFRAAGLAPTQC